MSLLPSDGSLISCLIERESNLYTRVATVNDEKVRQSKQVYNAISAIVGRYCHLSNSKNDKPSLLTSAESIMRWWYKWVYMLMVCFGYMHATRDISSRTTLLSTFTCMSSPSVIILYVEEGLR